MRSSFVIGWYSGLVSHNTLPSLAWVHERNFDGCLILSHVCVATNTLLASELCCCQQFPHSTDWSDLFEDVSITDDAQGPLWAILLCFHSTHNSPLLANHKVEWSWPSNTRPFITCFKLIDIVSGKKSELELYRLTCWFSADWNVTEVGEYRGVNSGKTPW